MIIEFGDWRLQPRDGVNWELCRRREMRETSVTRGNGMAGKVAWRPLGRFYQHGTFGEAILFAADAELRDGRRDVAVSLRDALSEYESIVDRLRKSFLDGFTIGD